MRYWFAASRICFDSTSAGYYCQSSLIWDSLLPSPAQYIGESRQPNIQPEISKVAEGAFGGVSTRFPPFRRYKEQE